MFGSATGNIKIPVKELKKAITLMRSVITRNPILPILENVLIQDIHGAVGILGSDLQNTLSIKIDHPSSTENNVSILLEFDRFAKLVSGINSEVITLTPGGSVVVIECEEGTFKMSSGNIDDFPKTPAVSYSNPDLAAGIDLIQEGLEIVKGSASSDDLRPAMTGIFFEPQESGELSLVATDGHRLAMAEYDVSAGKSNGESFILQRKAADIICKMKGTPAAVYFRWDKNNICVTYSNYILITRKIDERYPDWRKALPEHGNIFFGFDVKEFKKKVDLARIFSNTTTGQIRLKLEGDGVEISSKDYDYDTESKQSLPVHKAGFIPFEIGFNAKFLSETLKPYKTTAMIHFNAPNKGAIICPNDVKKAKNYYHLIMPVMLNEFV